MSDNPLQCSRTSIDNIFQNSEGGESRCQIFKRICNEGRFIYKTFNDNTVPIYFNFLTDIDGSFFIEQYYCGMFYNSIIVVGIFFIFFLIQSFYLLSQTAEEYLSPTVTFISKKIKMSQTLAGVTLLAIGNGANDIITAIVAGKGNNVNFTVGSIFGAGLFVTTISLARVLRKSPIKTVKPNKMMLLRDLLFFLFAIITVIIFGIIGYVNIYMAVAYIGIYILYIFVTLKQERGIKMQQTILEQELIKTYEMNEESVKPEQQITINISSPNLKSGNKKIKNQDLGNRFKQYIKRKSKSVGHLNISEDQDIRQKSDSNSSDSKSNSLDDIDYDSLKDNLHRDSEVFNFSNYAAENNDNITIQSDPDLFNYYKDNHYCSPIEINQQQQGTKTFENQANQENNITERISVTSTVDTEMPSQKSTQELQGDKTINQQTQNKNEEHYLSSTDLNQARNVGQNSKKQKNTKFQWMKAFKLRSFMKKQIFHINLQWKEQNGIQKVVFIWTFLSDLLLKSTIPPPNENWNKPRALTTCVLGPLFLIGSQSLIPDELMDPWHEHWFITPIFIAIGVILALVVWKTTHKSKKPSFVYLFSALTFLNSLSWIALIISTLVSFLNFIQFLTQISKVYLGMTFLALGNSAGYAQMAFTACYAGQLFNLLIGFGMTLLINSWKQGSMTFDLFGMVDHGQNLDTLMGYMICQMNISELVTRADIQLKCSVDYIQNYNILPGVNSACDVVEKACADQDGYSFMKLYYCNINQSVLMLIIFLLVFVFIAFHLLSSTAENYLSPALTNLSNKLGLSETLAGVTLVAIGNGAPDVIVAITAAQGGGHKDDDDDGISFTIGSIFGAGLFVTTMCLSLVLVKSGGEIRPNKQMFLRDMVFYWIAVATLIVFGIIGTVYWYMAVGFLMIYVVYIIVVIILEQKEKKDKLRKESENGEDSQVNQTQDEMLGAKLFRKSMHHDELESPSNQDTQNSLGNGSKLQTLEIEGTIVRTSDDGCKNITINVGEKQQNKDSAVQDSETISANKNQLDVPLQSNQHIDQIHSSKNPSAMTITHRIKDDHYKHHHHSEEDLKLAKQNSVKQKKATFFRMRHQIKLTMLNAKTEWADLEFGDKVIYLWEIPADFIRNITVPPSEENWSKWRAIVSCVFGPIFFIVSGFIPDDTFDPFTKKNWIVFPILGGVGIIFGFITWKVTHRNVAPSFVWIYSFLAFIISISWINLVANYLINFLSFIQIITQINKVFLGMTFLAFGNSAGDYFTNGQLAAMGYGNMALTACYAGQLFNLLVGFGLTMVISSGKNGLPFDLFGLKSVANKSEKIGNAIGYCIVFCALLNVTLMIIYSFSQKFTYGKSIGNFLRMFYLAVIIGAMCMGIASDIEKPTFTIKV